MPKQSQFYACFLTSDAWLQAARKADVWDVYAALLDENAGFSGGTDFRQAAIEMAYIVEDVAHLLRIKAGAWSLIAGQPFENDYTHRVAVAQTAWEITLEWLSAAHLSVHQAALAHPKDLSLAWGSAEYMTYDRNAKTWRPVQEVTS